MAYAVFIPGRYILIDLPLGMGLSFNRNPFVIMVGETAGFSPFYENSPSHFACNTYVIQQGKFNFSSIYMSIVHAL